MLEQFKNWGLFGEILTIFVRNSVRDEMGLSFSHHYDKVSVQINLEREGLILAHSGAEGYRVQCIIAEKTWQQAGRQLVLPHPVRKQREAMLMFSCLFLVPSRSPAHGMVPPTPRQVFPAHSLNLDKPSQKCPQICLFSSSRSCHVDNITGDLGQNAVLSIRFVPSKLQMEIEPPL